MSEVRHLGLVLPALLVAGLVPLVFPTAVAAQTSEAQTGEDQEWRPCAEESRVARMRKVEIVFAIDLSGSLEKSQRDQGGHKRRAALESVRVGLREVQEQWKEALAADDESPIHVGLVGFDEDKRAATELGPLTDEFPTDAQIGAVVTADDDRGDTDYGPAVEWARTQFDPSPDICRVFVLFTDGILDPLNTVAGRLTPAAEDAATGLAGQLLTRTCREGAGEDPDPELGPNFATYAVLLNSEFAEEASTSHGRQMAEFSKQLLLALTGDRTPSWMADVDSHSDCVAWSEKRNGTIIDFREIDGLARALAQVVAEVRREVLGPRLSCPGIDKAEALIEDAFPDTAWPGRVRLAHDDGRAVCTFTPPRSGKAWVSITGPDSPEGVEWRFNDLTSKQFDADDDERDLTITTAPLPGDKPLGTPLGTFDEAEVVIRLEWEDSAPGELSGTDAAETVQFKPLRFDVRNIPHREDKFWPVVDCSPVEASFPPSADKYEPARVEQLCTSAAPPAGTADFTLAAALDETAQPDPTLSWEEDGSWRFAAGEGLIQLDAVSRRFDESDPWDQFTNRVVVSWQWWSETDNLLLDGKWERPLEIDVDRPTPRLLQCDPGAASVAAFVSGTQEAEGDRIVLSTGCRLLAQSQGLVEVAVEGGAGRKRWEFVVPEGDGAGSIEGADRWHLPGTLKVEANEDAIDVYLAVDAGEGALRGQSDLGAETGIFELRATWSPPGAKDRDEASDRFAVPLDWPTLACGLTVPAERKWDEAGEARESLFWAAVPRICEVEAPAHGSVTVLPPDGEAEPWCLIIRDDADNSVGADDADDASAESPCKKPQPLDLEPGDSAIELDLVMGALVVGDRLRGFDRKLPIILRWESASGHLSEVVRAINVAVPPPGFLECPGEEDAVVVPGDEVPEDKLIVDTGYTLKAPHEGTVELVDVEGEIEMEGATEGEVMRVPWGLPEPVRLTRDDGDRRIKIESDRPLDDKRLITSSNFTLKATWQGVGSDPEEAGECDGTVSIDFMERSSVGLAVLIALGLLAAALLLAWVVLGLLSKRGNRLPDGRFALHQRRPVTRSGDETQLAVDVWVIAISSDADPNSADAIVKQERALGRLATQLPGASSTGRLTFAGADGDHTPHRFEGNRSVQDAGILRIRARTPRWWKLGKLLAGGWAEIKLARKDWIVATDWAMRGTNTLPLDLPEDSVVVAIDMARAETGRGRRGRWRDQIRD